MAAQLSPPGSSTYNSGTMTVGDGTWDSSRNSFLLPNLVGLNFQTMRYNGMGNRFRDLPGYKNIIVGHAVMAAITFLGIVPAAIFLAKYGRVWPGTRWSFKLHVYLQILTVFLSTVVLVLGWFAVGPERSLSNPHHGIGVAIYVLIIWQFIYGTFMYRRERRRSSFPNRLPLGVWIHKLQGRALALLAITQIALGLTLYGSPKILFILYALWIFFLIFAYLGLEFHYRDGYQGGGRPSGGGQPEFYSDYGSYLSGSRVESRPAPRKKESHWGRNILAGAGALGAYEWWKHRRDGRKEGREERYEESIDSRSAGPPPQGPMGPPPMGPSMGPPGPPGPMGPMGPPPMGGPPMGPPMGPPPMGPPPPRGYARNTRPPNGSRISRESWEDEKYSEPPRNTWRNRILGVTGAYAAYEGARSLFGRRRREDDYSDRSYTPPPGAQNVVSTHDVSRVEAGQAPTSPATPRVNMGGGQPMTPSMTPGQDAGRSGPAPGGTDLSYDSRDYDYTLRESMAEYGPLAGFREWNRARKMRREGDRTEAIRRQQIDSEQDYNRRNSNVYPLPQDADTRRASMSGTLLTGPSGVDPNAPPPPDGYLRPDTSHPPLPADAGTIPASSQYAGSRHDVRTDQNYSLPPPPPGPPPGAVRPDGYSPPQFGSARMPEGAVNPDPNRLVSENTAMNEASAYGRDPRGESVSAAAVSRDNISASPSRPSGSRNRLTKNSSMTSASASGIAGPAKQPNSPPVSVKVKMANDGRTVTLRRLPEEEAAAERAARRQDRRSRRRRNSSLSSGIEDDLPSGPRYRRTAPIRPSNDQPIANIPPPPPMSSSAGASLRRDSELNLPPAGAPPPPVPQHSVSPGSRQDLSSPPPTGGVNDSGFLSPGDAGTGTDISAFADNRRRRRAERARQAASRGGNKVEFE